MSEERVSRFRLRSSSITTVVSLSLVLLLLGILGLFVLNAQKISEVIREHYGFQVFINDNAKEPDVIKLQKQINASEYVKSIEFISKEEAAKTFSEEYGEDFVAIAGFNPLPSTINVHVKAGYANSDSLTKIVKSIESNKVVKEVIYQKDLLNEMNANINKIALVLLVFSVILIVIALVLINNTIRLAIYSTRFTIKTMQLVGATRAFIHWPFILRGIRQGIYSAIIAIGFLMLALYMFQRRMPELMEIQDPGLLANVFALVIILGIVISGLSTSLAVRKYLRLRTDELYY